MRATDRILQSATSLPGRHPTAVATAIAGAVCALFFFHASSIVANNTVVSLEERLEMLGANFSSDDVPPNCPGRSFPYFYPAESIDVTDRDSGDWDELHATAVASEEFSSSPRSKFSVAETSCGLAVTPYDNALHLQVLDRDAETRGDFLLRFAKSRNKEALYILGHTRIRGGEILPDRFRLLLYSDDQQTNQFTFTPVAGGEMKWESVDFDFSMATDSGSAEERIDESGYIGAWWDDGPDERYFEIRLHGLKRVTAFRISAEFFVRERLDGGKTEKGDEVAIRIERFTPIPLYEEMETWNVTRHLSRSLHYSLYLSKKDAGPVMLTSSAVPGGNPDALPPRPLQVAPAALPELLRTLSSAAYRLILLSLGYELCPPDLAGRHPETDLCFRETGEPVFVPYRLRKGEELPSTKDGERPRFLYVEETLATLPGNTSVVFLLVLFVVVLIVIMGYESQREIQALGDLARTNTNLKHFGKYFIHQGGGRYLQKIKDIVASTHLREAVEGREISRRIDILWERLEEAPEILRRYENVSRLLAAHGDNRFPLVESLRSVLADVGHLEFDPKLNGDERPLLPGTSSAKDHRAETPDNYFMEAVEGVVKNAVDYRDPETPIVVSVEREGGDAVVTISNDGPTIPEDKLESIFRLGTRFTGVGRQAEDRTETEESGHFGIGLFVTRQIIEAYRGTCRMANRPDESGVTMTMRLPCTW